MWFPVPVPIFCRYLAGTGTGTRGKGGSCLAFVRDEHHHLAVLVVVFLHRGVALANSEHVLQESRRGRRASNSIEVAVANSRRVTKVTMRN
jgi:hypothetical protein